MIIGVLSDAHGNFFAIKKCLDIFRRLGVNSLYFLGDAIGYYPEGDKVLSIINKSKIKCIKGNHEAMLLGDIQIDDRKDFIYKLKKQRDNISLKNKGIIEKWPCKIEEYVEHRRMLFVHGSPWDNLQEYIYPNSKLDKFISLSYDIIFMGHTHIPMIKKIGECIIVNVGSCGMPRDNGQLGSCVIFDTVEEKVEIIRFNLDVYKIDKYYTDFVHPDVIKCLHRNRKYERLEIDKDDMF